MTPKFELVSDFQPMGDQPEAIEGLVAGLKQGQRFQTLLGATGTGGESLRRTGEAVRSIETFEVCAAHRATNLRRAWVQN